MSHNESVQKYRKEKLELISVRVNKEMQINERLAILVAKGKAKSKQAFVVSAILAALEKAEKDMDANN